MCLEGLCVEGVNRLPHLYYNRFRHWNLILQTVILHTADTLVVPEDSVRSSTDEKLVDSSLFLDENKCYDSVVPAGQDKSTIVTTEDPEKDLPELPPEQLPVYPVALALNHLPVTSEKQTRIIFDQNSPPKNRWKHHSFKFTETSHRSTRRGRELPTDFTGRHSGRNIYENIYLVLYLLSNCLLQQNIVE